MKSFAAWGLTVIGLAIITSIAEMLLPKGKIKTSVRSVFAVVTALTVITPLPAFIKSGMNFDFSLDEIILDTEYTDYINSAKNELLAQSLEEYLKSCGHNGIKASVVSDGYEVISVTLDFTNSIINGSSSHINKKEIIGLTAEYFGVGEEAVMTYG